MKVAITGASGYVGSCVSACFRSHGHAVLSLSRRPCEAPWFSYSLEDEPRNLPWDGVDVLVHAAYDFTALTWSEILQKNVNPSVALLRAAKQAHVDRLIFISSMSSFDSCRSNYGRAKFLIEKEALAMGATIIRPGLVWGERSGGIMGTLETLVAKLPIIPFLSGGNGLKQYLIHEADLSETIVSTAEAMSIGTGTQHSVAHPTPVSLLEILKCIAKRSGLTRLYMPVPWRLVMAGLKSSEILGFRPPFRSDSLLGLVHSKPSLDLCCLRAGFLPRSFQ